MDVTSRRAWFVALFAVIVLITSLAMFMERVQHEYDLRPSYKVEQNASLLGLSNQAARAGRNGSSQVAYGKAVYNENMTVMFLCMPKCGTRSLREIFNRLWKINHFGAPTRIGAMLDNRSAADARREIDGKLTNAPDGTVLHGHYRYLDVGVAPRKPILMSIIRDPVSRFESHFYFVRFSDISGKNRGLNHHGNKAKNETVDDCVEKKLYECRSEHFRFMYVHSFCGYDVECNSPEYALQQAKQNVDKFLVIGITEEYDLSLRVFEKLLPATFSNSLNVYAQIKETSITKYKTSFKKPASPKTLSHLGNWMEKEYEFYDYVKEKFYRLVKRLGVGDQTESL